MSPGPHTQLSSILPSQFSSAATVLVFAPVHTSIAGTTSPIQSLGTPSVQLRLPARQVPAQLYSPSTNMHPTVAVKQGARIASSSVPLQSSSFPLQSSWIGLTVAVQMIWFPTHSERPIAQ